MPLVALNGLPCREVYGRLRNGPDGLQAMLVI